MDKCANAARRDDCSRIRHHVVLYIPLVSTTLEKDERGWHNQHTARHLCPQDMLTEFDADWLKYILAHIFTITSANMSVSLQIYKQHCDR